MSTRHSDSIPGRMTALALLGGALVVTVLVTVVISPYVLLALHGLGASAATLDGVTIRTLQLVAIAVTIIALRRIGAGGKAAWGIPVRDRLLPRVLLGIVYGLLSLGVVCGLVYLSEVRVIRPVLSMEPGYWLRVATGVLISAISVSLLEELWFRGGLFTLLSRLGGLGWALFGGSVLYAGAHFLDVPDSAESVPVSSSGSFYVLDAAVRNIFQLKNLDSFVALLFAGVTLAVVRMRQGDAAVCIGIHMGWVLTIKVFKKVTVLSPESPGQRLVGHYDGVIGWLAAACLAVMLLMIWRFMRPASGTPGGVQSVAGTQGMKSKPTTAVHGAPEIAPLDVDAASRGWFPSGEQLAISDSRYRWTARLFGMLERLLSVNLKLHGKDQIETGQIFLFNHFARFETFIPQYFIYRESGAFTRSIASSEFFSQDDPFSDYLLSLGAVPNRLPGLLPFLAGEVLKGRKIVVFPEGGIVKDRRVVDDHGRYAVYSRTANERRKHHSGAAVLALGLDLFQQSVLDAQRRGDAVRLTTLADSVEMEVDALLRKCKSPVTVVPSNITFYPIRVGENLLSKGAELISRGVSRRMSEELLIEGNILLENTDMDIRLGDTVHVQNYWRWWERPVLKRVIRRLNTIQEAFDIRPEKRLTREARACDLHAARNITHTR